MIDRLLNFASAARPARWAPSAWHGARRCGLRGAFALGCAVLATAGCASTGSDSDVLHTGVFQSGGQRTRGILLGDDNGLEVRQLVVMDDPQVIARTMGPWVGQTQGHVSAELLARLRRNGFRLVRVPLQELDELLDQLGGASMDVIAWHGPVLTWRDLHALALGEAGYTIAVDGRVRRYWGGAMQLLARAWVVPMEYGPRIQLELVPVHLRGQSQYHRLLGQDYRDARALGSLAMNIMLEPGYGYILTCEQPQVEWATEDDAANEATDAAGVHGSSGVGILTSMIGPEAETPMTLGELMLSSHGNRPSRGMLVFTGRVREGLYPMGEGVAYRSTERQP